MHERNGLETIGLALSSRDYGWNVYENCKKVILTNPKECENVQVLDLVSAWHGTTHSEWEFLLAGWFVMAVIRAVDSNNEEADITALFNRDLLAARNRKMTKEAIYKHIIPYFDIVEETDDVLKVKLRLA